MAKILKSCAGGRGRCCRSAPPLLTVGCGSPVADSPTGDGFDTTDGLGVLDVGEDGLVGLHVLRGPPLDLAGRRLHGHDAALQAIVADPAGPQLVTDVERVGELALELLGVDPVVEVRQGLALVAHPLGGTSVVVADVVDDQAGCQSSKRSDDHDDHDDGSGRDAGGVRRVGALVGPVDVGRRHGSPPI